MVLSPGTRLGPYRILAHLGAGGMGDVYRATDTRLGRAVAVKVLPEVFATDRLRLKRFEQEARTLSALNHPNIITIYDVGDHEGTPYLVMELLDGETLGRKLRDRALPGRKVTEIAVQVANGLAAAHASGVLHRDLKPENLFVCRDGRVKILDFGLAKQQVAVDAGSDTRAALSEPGQVMGTVGYMSPEQVRGATLDARSDLFSFGAVLWEMLSGRRAFSRDSPVETLHAILKDDPPDLDPALNVPPALARIVETCLAKDPVARFHSAHDLAFALEQLSAAGSGADVPVAGPRVPARRRRLGPLLSAASLGAVAIVAVVMWRSWQSTPPPTTRVPRVLAMPAKVLGAAESAFLTDAIPDTLSTLLAGASGLEMKEPPTAAQVDKLAGDPARIARLYNVDNLVFTTVTVQSDQLVLNVRLSEVATQKVRWAGQFRGTRNIYNELVRQAADALARALRPDSPPVDVHGLARGSDAELALQEGLHYQRRYNAFYQQRDFELAQSAFTRATTMAGVESAATGNLAWLFAHRAWSSVGPEAKKATVAEAESLARRAISLDPRNGAAWAALAEVALARQPVDRQQVLEYGVKAATFGGPGSWPEAVIGGTVGGPILMVATGTRAFDRNPLQLDAGAMAADGLVWQGKPEQALPIIDRILQVEPALRRGLVTKAGILIALGRPGEASELLKRCEPLDSDVAWDAEFWRQMRFQLAVMEGDTAAATRLADRAAALWLKSATGEIDINAPYTMPQGLVRIGRSNDAFQLISRGLAKTGPAEGYLVVLETPELRAMKDDPRYVKLLEQGKRAVAMTVRVLDQAKAAGELPAFLESALPQLKALLDR